MRIAIHHETRYLYDTSPTSVVQMLRMTPRSCNSQYVLDWRIDIDHDCRLVPRDDAFGNIVHGFSLVAPIRQIVVSVDGVVETSDTNGVVSGGVERGTVDGQRVLFCGAQALGLITTPSGAILPRK